MKIYIVGCFVRNKLCPIFNVLPFTNRQLALEYHKWLSEVYDDGTEIFFYEREADEWKLPLQ